MIKKFIAVACILPLLSLGACGKSPIESLREVGPGRIEVTDQGGNKTVTYSETQAQATTDKELVSECRRMIDEKEERSSKRLDTLASNASSDVQHVSAAFAFMHHDTMDMIKNRDGRDPYASCKPGTNVWDATIAWVESTEATKQKAISVAGDVTKFATGVAGAVEGTKAILNAAGDHLSGYAKKNEAGGSQSVTEGDGSPAIATSTEDHQTTTNTNTGDKGTINSSPVKSPVVASEEESEEETEDNAEETVQE